MRVLVTGATGFVGSHILRQLVDAGHTVRALVRREVRAPQPSVEYVRGDILDFASLKAAATGCEAVIHAAAELSFRPRDFVRQREVNVQGTRNAVEAAREAGVRRFVHTSSVSAIGRSGANGVTDEDARYDWPFGFHYNETKRDAEEIVRHARDLETVCLNPTMVFGPEEVYRRWLPLFKLVRWGLARVAPPGGFTVCDVRDVAAAHVSALTRGKPGARYILGGPHLAFIELLEILARLLEGGAPFARVPAMVIRVAAIPLVALEDLGLLESLPASPRYYPYLVGHPQYVSDRAIAELGYRVRLAEETLGDTVAWYTAQGLL
jgi:nucleoside-diphosphate-sugar epimerase